MGIGRIILLTIVMLALAAIYYTGFWHLFTVFAAQNPMLSWLPLLAMLVVGFAVGTARVTVAGRREERHRLSPEPGADLGEAAGPLEVPGVGVEPPGAPRRSAIGFSPGPGLLAGLGVLLFGLVVTLFAPPASGLDQIDYTVVDELPGKTQPRLLPRSGIRDDPSFAQSREIHLIRDPGDGTLLWTGEFGGSWLTGSSDGVVKQPLDDVITNAEVVRAGFENSAGGIGPATLRGQARIKHPFSRIQYPVMVPTGDREAIAMAPYVGYEGFPFRYPYLKGVLVYHQDGTLEDLTPEEAAARPELAATGRLVPETVAREQAEALARSDEFEGEIKDGKGNSQPYLTAIDRDTTVWVTIINHEQRNEGVRAIVLTDSTTGKTDVWEPDEGEGMISTEDVIAEARALPLRWEETRCCDSDGHSYTVDLREVTEPRLAFKNGRPFYLVTVVPTSDLALSRQVEYTLLIDARSGRKLDQFEHTRGELEDVRLQAFFR
jgi:hypothetical protein